MLDTNVIVSAAITKGYAFKIVDLFTSYRFYEAAYSVSNIAEYRRVSNYSRIANKYPLFKTEVDAFIKDLLIAGREYEVEERFILIKDLSDNSSLTWLMPARLIILSPAITLISILLNFVLPEL